VIITPGIFVQRVVQVPHVPQEIAK
jgi:acyl CoA:acetate/3-ketoacid CoA transferase alpha subunit